MANKYCIVLYTEEAFAYGVVSVNPLGLYLTKQRRLRRPLAMS